VRSTTKDKEQPNKHRAQTRPESIIVVPRALPQRKAVFQEMVVAVAAGALEDVGDEV
jgi:hypothetical protein